MGESASADTWSQWFLDAIRKIRSQKQRPSVERICHAIRQHHNYHEEEIGEHLEIAVKRGDVLKIFNKGQSSYKDPVGLQSKPLKVAKTADLSKVLGKAVRELGERDGSTLKNIEKYVRQSHTVEEESEGDLKIALRLSAKRAVDRGLVLQDGRLFRQPDRPPAKKVETPPHSSGSEASTKLPAPLPICRECLGTTAAGSNNNTKKGGVEKLSRCSICGAALHFSCTPSDLGFVIERGATWSCDDCSPTCAGCKLERESQNYLVKCSGCPKCYHPSCLDPALDKKSKAPWRCRHCQTSHGNTSDHGKRGSKQVDSGSQDESSPISSRKRFSKIRENRKSAASRKSLALTPSIKKSSVSGIGSPGACGTVSQVDSSSDEETLLPQTLPPGVTQRDLDLFKEAREQANRFTDDLEDVDHTLTSPGGTGPGVGTRNPAAIVFGRFEVETWYSSPFPQEYARLPKLFFCEFCLKYTKSRAVLDRHMDKCQWRHPPATEIYRCGGLSVFEIDGNVNKIYCQNLCLLAKLFLDHKTLYYDVEPFLFYAVTKNDKYGCHLVGYFSKEKHCPAQRYNVSCIMTLPQYQRQGFGRFLIEFSYLLSKVEGIPGTPEKPLSDLGRVSYHSFWKSVVLEYLDTHRDAKEIKLGEITKETGVSAHDIATALQLLGFVRSLDNNSNKNSDSTKSKVAVVVNWGKVNAHMLKVKNSSRILLDQDCLRWIPLVTQIPNPYQNLEDGELSSENSPIVEQKPVTAMVEKIQRVKIKKKPRSRRVGARRSLSMRKSPQKSPQKPKEVKKDSGIIDDEEEEDEDRDEEPKVLTPRNSRNSVNSRNSMSWRKIRTPKNKADRNDNSLCDAKPISVTPSRKRKHSEKTEEEEVVKKVPEVFSGRKRTRESLREKMKEKIEESSEERKTPVKEVQTPETKQKKQSKLDDILMKVTSRQNKHLQAKQAKDKKAQSQPEEAKCNGEKEIVVKEKEKEKNTPSSTRRRGKVVEKHLNVDSVRKIEEKIEKPKRREIQTPIRSTPNRNETLKVSRASSKQLTLPEMVNQNAAKKKIEEEKKKQEAIVEEPSVVAVIENEVVTSSPGEYEGGDEDDGEEEDEVEEPTKTKSISNSCRNLSNNKLKNTPKESEKLMVEKEIEKVGKVQDTFEPESLTENNSPKEKEEEKTIEAPCNQISEDLVKETSEDKISEAPKSIVESSTDIEKPEVKPPIEEVSNPILEQKQCSPIPEKIEKVDKTEKYCEIKDSDQVPPSLTTPITPKESPSIPEVLEQEQQSYKESPQVEEKVHETQEHQTMHQTLPEEKQHSPESGKSTPHMENPGSVKRTPPSQPDLPSMGVYTPDSTTNSVHSLHYGQCDLDVSQLGLESPTSIASDLASQHSVERPPSALPSITTNVPAPLNSNPLQIPPPSTMIPQVQYDQVQCVMTQHPSHISMHPMHQTSQQPRTPQSHTPLSIPTHSPQPIPQSHTPQPIPQSHTPQPIPQSHTPQPIPQSHTPQPIPQSHTPQPMPQSHTPQPISHSQNIPTHSPQPMQLMNLQGNHQQSHNTSNHQSHSSSGSSKRANGSQTHRSRSNQQSRSHRATPPTSHSQSSSQHISSHSGNHTTVAHGTGLPPQYQQTSMSVPPVPHHSHSHSHNMAVISQGNYMATVASQAFPSQNTYVIQHRGGRSGAPTPCTTATNFYIQTSAMPPHSHTPSPSSLPTGNHQTPNSCSLAKLQQLTNGLEMIPPTPPPSMNLTPPPPIPHTMTPPQNSRQLATPPQVPLGYAKNYYNVNSGIPPPGSSGPPSRSVSRSSANANMSLAQPYSSESLYRQTLDPGGGCPQMQSAGARVSPNVALNTNLMAAAQYGYRVTQPTTGYMNQAAQIGGFMNQAGQLPVGVVNVPAPYSQDPNQHNPPAVYTAYHGYINSSLMPPLNGTMRPR